MSIGETVFQPIGVETVASSATAVSSAAFPDGTEAVRLVATQNAYARFGSSSLPASSSTTGSYLPANIPEYFKASPGQKVSVIRDSADGSLFITYLARD